MLSSPPATAIFALKMESYSLLMNHNRNKKAKTSKSNPPPATSTITPPTTAPNRKSNTTSHLEEIAHSLISAINSRQFNTSLPPYNHISSSFSGDLERPPDAVRLGLKGLEEQMEMYRYVTTQYPDYWVRIFDLNTEVDEKEGKAVIYFSGETGGMIEGLVMPSVGELWFERREDDEGKRWLCVSSRGVRGMVDGCVWKLAREAFEGRPFLDI